MVMAAPALPGPTLIQNIKRRQEAEARAGKFQCGAQRFPVNTDELS